LSTDPVRNGATDIQNLATALETRGQGNRTQAGRFQGTTQPTGVALIAFPVAFKAGTTPSIVAWPGWSQANAGAIILMFEDIVYGWSNTGFHVLIRNHDGAALGALGIDVQWIAVGAA
jgi:hypothetical protein